MTISREMLFPLAFYKKSVFNGSREKMNYRIEKKENEEKKKNFFLLSGKDLSVMMRRRKRKRPSIMISVKRGCRKLWSSLMSCSK